MGASSGSDSCGDAGLGDCFAFATNRPDAERGWATRLEGEADAPAARALPADGAALRAGEHLVFAGCRSVMTISR
jgi:hypothetical protein